MKRYKQEWCKRLVSSFLILCMLCTSIDLTVFAGREDNPTSSNKTQETVSNKSGVGTVSENISKGSGQITSFDKNCSWAQNQNKKMCKLEILWEFSKHIFLFAEIKSYKINCQIISKKKNGYPNDYPVT